jgi:DNA ligase-1
MLDHQERFVFNKLLTGSFRVGVSQNLVIKALSDISDIDAPTLTHRIMGSWMPETYTYDQLIEEQDAAANISRPYPFFLAYPIQETSEKQKSADDLEAALGDAAEWQAEWKWDGIRAQMIKRGGEIFIWSRGEDLATAKFPELHPFLNALPDGTVIDGEILSFQNGLPLPFNVLQTRIGRKNLTKKILEDSPVAVIAYDCLEYKGEDIRYKTQSERREILEQLQSASLYRETFRISALISYHNWEELSAIREQSRAMVAEGIMLKRKSATYQVGRRRGDWWKWKIDPLSVDAVMIYAQKGHGRRADLYTDYTFAVWDGDKLVPFAKAYSGLTDTEINKVDYFVKRNTLEKFGPVRTVKPELVFEIGFEGINRSTRHKSGIALRFPRILRWRHDKPKEEADTIESLRALLGD